MQVSMKTWTMKWWWWWIMMWPFFGLILQENIEFSVSEPSCISPWPVYLSFFCSCVSSSYVQNILLLLPPTEWSETQIISPLTSSLCCFCPPILKVVFIYLVLSFCINQFVYLLFMFSSSPMHPPLSFISYFDVHTSLSNVDMKEKVELPSLFSVI